MRIPQLKMLAVLALAAVSSLALAQEPPGRVGRVAVAQGQVSISADVGEEAAPALVNWPVTSRNQITTGAGARTELRVGSSVVRLDGDSSLDIVQLDDDNLRLHLHYGSVTVRLRNAEALPGFELSTPQGRITLQDLGRLRVDAERVQGTTAVTSFDGALARVDGGGGSVLIVRSGKRLDLRADDIRTGLAGSDSFDDWGMLRDARDARVTSDRYVTNEMTGYEELDQNGAWRDDAELGPVWYPSAVGVDWAPYRDGRWTWVAPWGWTWVDNAPWGYAPFHYGRWVMVDRRWGWAPGRNVGRPVWSPALVGWVGGSNWNVTFGAGGAHRQAPAQGWYPLAPREAFAPAYHVSPERLHYINRFARPDARPDPAHHVGLTVVPQDQFGHRGPVLVNTAPRATVLPQVAQNLPMAAPPAPVGAHRPGEVRNVGEVRNLGDGRNVGEGRNGRDGRGEPRPAPVVLSAPAAVAAPARPAGVVASQPGGAVGNPLRDERNGRNGDEGRRDGRNGLDDGRHAPTQPGAVATTPAVPAAAQQPAQQQAMQMQQARQAEQQQARQAEQQQARQAELAQQRQAQQQREGAALVNAAAQQQQQHAAAEAQARAEAINRSGRNGEQEREHRQRQAEAQAQQQARAPAAAAAPQDKEKDKEKEAKRRNEERDHGDHR